MVGKNDNTKEGRKSQLSDQRCTLHTVLRLLQHRHVLFNTCNNFRSLDGKLRAKDSKRLTIKKIQPEPRLSCEIMAFDDCDLKINERLLIIFTCWNKTL